MSYGFLKGVHAHVCNRLVFALACFGNLFEFPQVTPETLKDHQKMWKNVASMANEAPTITSTCHFPWEIANVCMGMLQKSIRET